MKKFFILLLFISIFLTFFSIAAFALNPFITHVYTADPSAHVFEGRVYVYPSHDKDNANGYDMEDYHAFSSADMINWVDHGVILHKNDVPWVSSYFWAPDCAYRDGKYYLYFPAKDKSGNFKIGAAIGNSPAGPFKALDIAIPNSSSVDPCVFVDDDGSAYMFFGGQGDGGRSGKGPLWVKLKSNMIDFDGTPQEITSGVNYWFEACWVHKRNGNYYLSYSTGNNITNDEPKDSLIHYSMSTNIAGPWTYKGLVIDDVQGWTNHHSFVEFKDNWYAFYHTSDLSGGVDNKRSICVDKLNYNADGTMQVINITRSGLGTSAYSRIKAMLFSGKKNESEIKCTEDVGGWDIGKNVGWIKNDDFIYFDNVDFGSMGAIGFEAEVATDSDGGIIQIRDNAANGSLIGELTVDNTGGWHNWIIKSNLLYNGLLGKHNIYLVFKRKSNSSSTYLLNLNSFRFTYDSPVIPIGHTVSLKSKNPESIDNNEFLVNENFNIGSEGQKYLCADRYQGYDLCANRANVGKENKFNILNNYVDMGDGRINDYIQLNSSSNGRNLKIIDREINGEIQKIINAIGGDYKNTTKPECFYLLQNDDNTMLIQNLDNYKLAVVKSWVSKDPAIVYCDSDNRNGNFERFYCEAQDAPIGCTVALKTLGYFKKRNTDIEYTDLGQMYLCADTWNMGTGGALCADRSDIGYDSTYGEWEKFLVVDAKNGYIALRSYNKDPNNLPNNQYLRVDPNDKICKVNGGNTINDNYERFQWINNGDGTISLKNVGLNQILSVVNLDGNGNLTNPPKVYANKSKVSNDPDSHEKFYCQIVASRN